MSGCFIVNVTEGKSGPADIFNMLVANCKMQIVLSRREPIASGSEELLFATKTCLLLGMCRTVPFLMNNWWLKS